MSWTGTIPPKRMKIITEYEDGKLVRQSTTVHTDGGINLIELRCTCAYPEADCPLHGKAADG